MSLLTGTEPAGFGCSASRTDRKLGRRSLYTSLLSSASTSSGCRGTSGVTASTGSSRNGETEDFDALQREELLQLYIAEEAPSKSGGGWAELFTQRLRHAVSFVEECVVMLITPLKKYGAKQRNSSYSHRRHTAGGEGRSELDNPQTGKDRKKLLRRSGVEDARVTVKRFWWRLLVGKWNGIFVLVPVCAVGLFFFGLALFCFHPGSVEEEGPGAEDLLHTAREAAGNAPVARDGHLLLRAKQSDQHADYRRQREQPSVAVETRNADPAFRTNEHRQDSMESQGGDHITTPFMMFAADAPLSRENFARVPLRRRNLSSATGGAEGATTSPFSLELQQYLAVTFDRHQKKLPLMEPGAPEAITPLQTDVIIHDFMNSQYVIEVGVGTPPQVVRAIADTGSSDFWACSEKCGVFCMLHKVYHHNKSSTYSPDNSPYNITYVGGPVSGFLSLDNVSIGDLTAQHLLFAEADNVKGLGPAFFFGHFDGVLGMGLPATATHGLKPLMQTAIEQKLLKNWVFAFYLSSDDSVDGELTLGGYDSSRIDGPIVYSPLVDKRYWMINSQGLQIKEDIISSTTRVIIDSGTTLIAGPLDEVDRIAHMFGAFSVPMLPKGTYLISCEEAFVLEDLALLIEGHAFTVRATDLVIKVSDVKGVPCLFGMIGLQILEGTQRYKSPHHRKATAAEKRQAGTVAQQAMRSRGSLLTRLLAEEALLTATADQTLQRQSAQEDLGPDFSGPLPATARDQVVHAGPPLGSGSRGSGRLTDLGRLWIFGDVFMRQAYTIFDYDQKRIGFAKLGSTREKKLKIRSMERQR